MPGLHIESWALWPSPRPSRPHDEALARLLEAGAELLGGRYTELTDVDEISARLKPDVIATTKPVLTDAAA